jgi:hypothetical protein
VSADGCGAPAGGAPVSAAADAGTQAVVQGRVTQNGAAVPVGYARLLNSDGRFRFFAAPGSWTLRVLAPGDVRAERLVSADIGKITELEVAV